jgi:RimJ/RimL family protein N-acetyltransferase
VRASGRRPSPFSSAEVSETDAALRTERLILRQWRAEDREPFAALNADPVVMEYFPGTLDRAASDAFFERIAADSERLGFGLWAVEVVGVAPFVGFVGLNEPTFDAHFTPAIEVGWRLDRAFWRHGYATEAAMAALRVGFDDLKLDQIVSFTVPANVRSRRVMERIGMKHEPEDDFDHPRFPFGHRCCRHVLYRLSRARWTTLRGLTQPEA